MTVLLTKNRENPFLAVMILDRERKEKKSEAKYIVRQALNWTFCFLKYIQPEAYSIVLLCAVLNTTSYAAHQTPPCRRMLRLNSGLLQR
jgi:hypothetical protein